MTTRPTIAPATKCCTGCGETKPLAAFYAHPTMGDGRDAKCMQCKRRASLARYYKRKDELRVVGDGEKEGEKR